MSLSIYNSIDRVICNDNSVEIVSLVFFSIQKAFLEKVYDMKFIWMRNILLLIYKMIKH